jgi:hypothetical protein
MQAVHVLMLVGLAIDGLLFRNYLRRLPEMRKKLATWIKTTGVVVERHRSESRGDVTLSETIEYLDLRGNKHLHVCPDTDYPNELGATIKIEYDPVNPDDSVMYGHTGWYGVHLIIALIINLVLVLPGVLTLLFG